MMESKARLLDIAKDWKSGKFRLTFEVDTFLPNMADAIADVCLRLSVKKWKEKRSLDANAYMWVLLGKMAQLLETTPKELHDEMLQRYGILDQDEDGHVAMTISSRVDISRIDGYWRLYKTSQDGKWNSYLRIKGTSELDTAEMSYFIKRVVEEAQDLGIETATPEELERMAALCERRAG